MPGRIHVKHSLHITSITRSGCCKGILAIVQTRHLAQVKYGRAKLRIIERREDIGKVGNVTDTIPLGSASLFKCASCV